VNFSFEFSFDFPWIFPWIFLWMLPWIAPDRFPEAVAAGARRSNRCYEPAGMGLAVSIPDEAFIMLPRERYHDFVIVPF
jgi:hypothetical protein